jgi:hypothetical protein
MPPTETPAMALVLCENLAKGFVSFFIFLFLFFTREEKDGLEDGRGCVLVWRVCAQ